MPNNDQRDQDLRSVKVEAFHAEVESLVAKGMTRTAAHNQVCRTREDLRSALVEDHNEREREKATRKTRRK